MRADKDNRSYESELHKGNDESQRREGNRWNGGRQDSGQKRAVAGKTVKTVIGSWLDWIRNTRILRKYPVYEIEKTEKRYEAMANKGWLLYKRGGRLEYFRKGEPQKLQYRMEYCPVKALDGIQDLTEEQVDFYEDCGWSLVSDRNGVYVFSAPEESEPMELYSDPREQIRMLKSVHHYVGNFATVFIGCWAGSIAGRALTGEQSLLSWEAFHCIDWIWLCSASLLLYVIWEDCYAAFRCRQLIHRVKKGKPIHHLPGERESKHRIAKLGRAVVLGLAGITAAGSILMLARMTVTPLSQVGEDRKYLLAQEVYEGARADRNIFGREEKNSVTKVSALTADYYEVCEYLTNEDKDFVSLDQKLYVLRDFGGDTEKPAKRLADSLLKGSVFRDDGKTVIEHPDFDYVASAQYTLVAVKGNLVIRVTCIASGELEKGWDEVLLVLAEKWK